MPMSMRCINVSRRNPGELTVSEIKSLKKGIEVSFSNGGKLLLSPDSYTEFHLYSGKEISPSEHKELERFAESDALYSQALSWLSRSRLSIKETRQRLSEKNADPKLVETVISRLESQHLLDDEAYVKEYLEYRAYPSLYGVKRIRFELSQKGIGDDLISKLSFPEEKEIKRAKEFVELQARKLSNVPLGQRKRKLLMALQSRGFSLEVAEQATASVSIPFDPKKERTSLEMEFAKAKAHYEVKYQGYDLRERIYARLTRTGYRSADIKQILEENDL